MSALEQHVVALLAADTPAPGPMWGAAHGAAVDGTYRRGAGTHGSPMLLVSLVQHASALVVGQVAVPDEQHESRGVAQLLRGRDLRGMVITLDAGLTHPALATRILAQGGHDVMVVKRNQARLYQELSWYVDMPPLPCDRPWRTCTLVTKGHGRLEQRTVTCTNDLDDYLMWPVVQQVLRWECARIVLQTGQTSAMMTDALTSLSAAEARAQDMAVVWRGQWTIEHRVHDVRDVTLGEDAHQTHVGNAPQAVAALRHALVNRLRASGWTNMAAALRHYACAVPDAFYGSTIHMLQRCVDLECTHELR